jgi:pimeloyl-ACP methyl ester carboxylesterase
MKKIFLFFQVVVLIASGFLQTSPAQSNSVKRKDFWVSGDGAIKLFVREVSASSKASKVPILMLHGARVPGVASFDLPVKNGSLAEDLARAGHPVYLMDARGYGRSTRLPEMSDKPEDNPPLVRSTEVVRDLAAVVKEIRKRTKHEKIALFGWATGGHWIGFYASLYPETVSHLISLNSLYGGFAKHATLGPGSDLEDPARKGQFNRKAFGAYRLNTFESFLRGWDRNIPLEDKSAWRAPEMVAAVEKAVLDSDSTSRSRTPPTFRSPSGAFEDSFYLASGRRLWDASFIKAHCLLIRSERDFWSRPEDVEQLAEDLIHAEKVATLIIPNATHMVHLDRPERGRDLLIKTMLDFLAEK